MNDLLLTFIVMSAPLWMFASKFLLAFYLRTMQVSGEAVIPLHAAMHTP
jgi:hypothetical protein